MWQHWHIPTCSGLGESPWTIYQVSVMHKTAKIYMCVSLWTMPWASTIHTMLEFSLVKKKLTICHLTDSFCETGGVETFQFCWYIYIYIYIYIYASCNSMVSIPIQIKQWKITNFSQPIKILIMCTITPDSLHEYHNNVFTGTFTDFNLHNQLHMHKICSPDVNKPPTCFGTSQVPLSDSPLSTHHSTLKMVCCTVGE